MRWLFCIALAASLSSTVQAHDKKPFGPWDAGATRPVSRQSKKGIARPAFPAVGDAAKVPGEGPSPPPLHVDPAVPESLRGANDVGSSLSANPLYLASLFYANVITKMDGARCQHYPTCSRFANQAVARYGVLGIPIGLDRLIQPGESSAVRRMPEMEHNGTVRFYDPVENYVFWHPEYFTGLPPPTAEQPFTLPPLNPLLSLDAVTP